MTALDEAKAFATRHGWPVTDDLTETRTGRATPVLCVETEDLPAVLRTQMTEPAAVALMALRDSGATPAVYDHGTDQSVGRWVLCEWVVGEPLLVPAGATRKGVVAVAGATPEVVDALRLLHHHPAPASAQAERVESLTDLEVSVLTSTQMAESTPPLGDIGRRLWAPAVQLHGDVLPTNVIRGDDGRICLIDPEGGFGPPEADVGRWLAGLSFFQAGMVGSIDELAAVTCELVDIALTYASWLDRRRLHAWTAVQLCEAAMGAAAGGEVWAAYRTHVRIAGLLYRRGMSARWGVRVGRNAPARVGPAPSSSTAAAARPPAPVGPPTPTNAAPTLHR